MELEQIRSQVASGQFRAAYCNVERILLDPTTGRSRKAKLLLLGVHAAAGLHEVHTAVRMAERAVEAAELGDDWEDIGNARLQAALSYREAGDTPQALRFFQLFFQHLDRYQSLRPLTCQAYFNLGLAHQQRQAFREALDAYRLALQEFRQNGASSGVVVSLQNAARMLLLDGGTEEAEPYLTESAFLSARLQEPTCRASQLAVEALYAQRMGDPDRATLLCEELFRPDRAGVGEHHLAEAAWIMAEVALSNDRFGEASIFADLAMSHALQAKEPHLMSLAADVKQKVVRKKSGLRA